MKISVIIPVYNAEKYLRVCLESFVNQTEKDIEIICVDDGSTDKSLEILNRYKENYSNFFVYTQSNQGAGAARNLGIEKAKGEYLYFFDADDFAEPNLCEEVYQTALRNGKPDVIRFAGECFDSKSLKYVKNSFIEMTFFPKKFFYKNITIDDIIDNNLSTPCPPWLGFCRKNFVIENDIKFDNFKCANDIGFYIHTLAEAKSIYFINKKYVKYRVNSKTNLSANRAENYDCQIKVFNKIKEIIKDDKIKKYFLKNYLMNDILYFYGKFLFTKYGSNIHYQTQNFLKGIYLKSLDINFDFKNLKNMAAWTLLHSVKYFSLNICRGIFFIYKIYSFIRK